MIKLEMQQIGLKMLRPSLKMNATISVNTIRIQYSRARELRAQPGPKYARGVFRRRESVWKPEHYNVQSHHTQNRGYQDEKTRIAGQYDYFFTGLRPQRRVTGQVHLRLYRDVHGWRHHRSEESV